VYLLISLIFIFYPLVVSVYSCGFFRSDPQVIGVEFESENNPVELLRFFLNHIETNKNHGTFCLQDQPPEPKNKNEK